jgi:hypothetical protein
MPYVKAPTPQSETGAPGIIDVFRSSNVYVNNVLVALWQDAQGSESAAQSQIFGPDFQLDEAITELDGDEDPQFVERQQRQLISQGLLTSQDLDISSRIVAGTVDASPPVVVTPTVTTSTVNLADLEFPDSYPLTANYTLGQMTKRPNVIFEHQVQPSAGLTTAQVVANLQLLTANCVEPIKAQYPNAFVTNSFRVGKPGSRSQHPKGQACDLQFNNVSKADYHTIAQWIRDNVSYDQLLLEYKTTGTGLPWIHISYNNAGNRSQVKTFLNNKVHHKTGLVDLSQTQ